MTPTHHLESELLLDYAAGAVPEPVALLIATHLALCPVCRDAAQKLDAVGGALLDEVPPADVHPDALARVLARIEDSTPQISRRQDAAMSRSDLLPAPLRAYVPAGLDALPWHEVMKGLSEARLSCGGKTAYRASLFRITAGRAVPKHTHRGNEMLIILDGSFSDEFGHYARGDVEIADPTVEHRPVADGGRDCLCLAVQDAPIKLTGRFARLLNPFIR